VINQGFVLVGAAVAVTLVSGAAPRPAPVTALQFSPDSSALVSSGYRSVVVTPLRDEPLPRRIESELSQVRSLAFSPNGKLLAVGGGTPGEQGAAEVGSWPPKKQYPTLGGHQDLVTAVAFSPDSGRIATGSADTTVRIWKAPPGSEGPLLTLKGHAGPVLGVAYSPDGKLIVTASADRSLKVWDTSTGALIRSLTNHTDVVHSVAFRPPNIQNQNPHPYCVSASDDRTVRVWQSGIGRMVRIVRGHSGAALTAIYGKDGGTIFSAGTEGSVRVIDADSDELLKSWKASSGWIYSLALSPDGRVLATGDWDGRVRRWEAATGRELTAVAPEPAR
jgi:WD40 repeat protein